MTRPGFEPTTYRTRGEHANQYITDAVLVSLNCIQESGVTNVKKKYVYKGNNKIIELRTILQRESQQS